MAAKKKSSGTKTKTVYRTVQAKTKRKRKSNTGVKDIPAAGMAVGIIAANAGGPIKTAVSQMSVYGVKQAVKQFVEPENLKKTAIYAVGGAVAGTVIQKFAPNMIKKPIGLVAKKIKGVF